MRKEYSFTEEAMVIKTPRGYLYDVWEHLNDEKENFEFVDDIRYAQKFYPHLRQLKAPKYLYHLETGASIDTLEEAAAYLNGKLQEVSITRTVIYDIKEEEE
ncbi:hypothetical protein HWC53_gp083 [Bacillus phage vB_BmeM-Goe8]|uniref:Uncharacterized protein n=1 Tax=Bacillus phage vB_BmeM-Goe8 TaxID=2593638 RepID=A0A516KN44_9CAUD|nr:hypothetical protein HWC53_gp083 [Bacillus phage vB_BmeM-Goe8]QDP43006.1 hypothetical protein Goe8_c02330 [Bacillus phage vB_BmeM-Goe8]